MVDMQVYKAAVSDPDTLFYDEVLGDVDIEKWEEVANAEIQVLQAKHV